MIGWLSARWIKFRGFIWDAVDNLSCGPAPGTEPVPFALVLDDELTHSTGQAPIGAPDPPPGTASQEELEAHEKKLEAYDKRLETYEADVFRRAHSANLIGLSFSGGGIRSATFNLGVLQALADLRLLRHVHYLSTVSGGSYIGSWLSALIHREIRKPGNGMGDVEKRLRSPTSAEPSRGCAGSDDQPRGEDSAVTFLRRYSNYMTPRLGLFTADTWSVVAIYLRNLLLNLTLLTIGLAAFFLLPRLIVAVNPGRAVLAESGLFSLTGWLGMTALFAMIAALFLGRFFASSMEPDDKNNGSSHWQTAEEEDPAADFGESPTVGPRQPEILWGVVAPLILAAFAASLWIPAAEAASWALWSSWTATAYFCTWVLALLGALLYASRRGGFTRRGESRGVIPTSTTWVWLAVTAVPAGLLCGLLLKAVSGLLKRLTAHDVWASWVLGTPTIFLWLLTLGVLHIGFMGIALRDDQREWLSRLGAWLVIAGTAWGLWFAVVVYGPVICSALEGWLGGAAVSGWLVATLSGLVAARRDTVTQGAAGEVRALLLATTPYIFAVGLLMVLATGLDWSLSRSVTCDSWGAFREKVEVINDEVKTHRRLDEQTRARSEAPAHWSALVAAHRGLLQATTQDQGRPLVVIILGLFFAGGLLAWRIDVNEFSLHGLYRNRLVRCYLGASVPAPVRRRREQPFTGFSRDDDIDLANLYPAGPENRRLADKRVPFI